MSDSEGHKGSSTDSNTSVLNAQIMELQYFVDKISETVKSVKYTSGDHLPRMENRRFPILCQTCYDVEDSEKYTSPSVIPCYGNKTATIMSVKTHLSGSHHQERLQKGLGNGNSLYCMVCERYILLSVNYDVESHFGGSVHTANCKSKFYSSGFVSQPPTKYELSPADLANIECSLDCLRKKISQLHLMPSVEVKDKVSPTASTANSFKESDEFSSRPDQHPMSIRCRSPDRQNGYDVPFCEFDHFWCDNCQCPLGIAHDSVATIHNIAAHFRGARHTSNFKSSGSTLFCSLCGGKISFPNNVGEEVKKKLRAHMNICFQEFQ